MKCLCVKCNQKKDSIEFYANDRKCKECRKALVRANREAKKEYYQEYDRKRANNPDRVAAREAYGKTEAGKKAKQAAQKRWQDRNQNKRKAHVMVGNAIRDGKLVKQNCEVCGNSVVDAHHDDYSKPMNVRWLCRVHHAQWHKEH